VLQDRFDVPFGEGLRPDRRRHAGRDAVQLAKPSEAPSARDGRTRPTNLATEGQREVVMLSWPPPGPPDFDALVLGVCLDPESRCFRIRQRRDRAGKRARRSRRARRGRTAPARTRRAASRSNARHAIGHGTDGLALGGRRDARRFSDSRRRREVPADRYDHPTARNLPPASLS